MTWLKKDDRFPGHRKIRRLSDGAYRLHDTALCYAAEDETDGRILTDDLEEMQHGRRLRKYVPELVKSGLWELTDDGWLLHDYLDYNPSHVQLEAERAAARLRQRRSRANRAGVTSEDVDGHAVTNGVTHTEVTRESQAPVPSRTEPNRTATTTAPSVQARATRLPDAWTPTDEHIKRAQETRVDVGRELIKFRAYAQEKGKTAQNWNAAFTRWLMNAAEYAARDARRPTQQSRVDQNLDVVRHIAERDGLLAPQIGAGS